MYVILFSEISISHLEMMSNTTPPYPFRLNHIQMDVPYTDMTINIYPPWTYLLAFGSCLVYLFLISTIFPLFKSKFNKSFATNHYALLFVYSLLTFLAAFIYIIQTQQISNWRDYTCVPMPTWLRALSITFVASKIWEWFDTAVLISKGHSFSKIGFLHIYHHATTFLLFLSIMNLPGGEKSGLLFNGFVHTLMYYHFAFRLPKLLRPVITALQIVQLAWSTYIWHVTPGLCPQYRDFPRQNRIEFLLPYILVPVYCLFFLKFFFEQYLCATARKSASSPVKDE